MNNSEDIKDKVIDGKSIADRVEKGVKEDVERFKKKYGCAPRLATILVGEHPPSKLYVRLKHWACKRVGIDSMNYKFDENVSEKEILSLIESLNEDDKVNGILVQMPLPPHIDALKVMGSVSPIKDVDGFHPLNMGRLMQGDESWLVPCTPKGVIEALNIYGIDVQGQYAVVVGHSNIVGKPMAAMFLNRNATVSVCHVYTKNLVDYTREADILVVATGVKGLIKKDMIKEDSIVFDVGITWEDGKVYGDVVFDDVVKRARLVSPVPGGVGPLTIAMLLTHTMKAAWKQKEREET
jgi:methylenetetrahydrofolate dehydrogenase (NADP+)/methenyltetrahydrofolate cyclohydrolase